MVRHHRVGCYAVVSPDAGRGPRRRAGARLRRSLEQRHPAFKECWRCWGWVLGCWGVGVWVGRSRQTSTGARKGVEVCTSPRFGAARRCAGRRTKTNKQFCAPRMCAPPLLLPVPTVALPRAALGQRKCRAASDHSASEHDRIEASDSCRRHDDRSKIQCYALHYYHYNEFTYSTNSTFTIGTIRRSRNIVILLFYSWAK